MSIATLADGARQKLGGGLEALQAADAPPALLEVAAPLARALSVLVQVEREPRAFERAALEPALNGLREGLRLLQLPEHIGHPAAERGMAAVAETLGVVLEIAQCLEAQKDRPTPLPIAPPAAAQVEHGGESRARGAKRKPAMDAVDAVRSVEAELGAHSATNFYKGLSGGDIVASGGLFIATYQVPEVGQKLLLRVSMPGGYEFEAKGVVAWTRDVRPSATASGASPGYGAQINEISDEGRGLIQRYVRNREPLFHDDL